MLLLKAIKVWIVGLAGFNSRVFYLHLRSRSTHLSQSSSGCNSRGPFSNKYRRGGLGGYRYLTNPWSLSHCL